MKRFARRLGIFLLLTFVALFSYFVTSAFLAGRGEMRWTTPLRSLETAVEAEARKLGIVLDIGELSWRFPLGINASSIGVEFPAQDFRFPFFATRASGFLSIWQLFSLTFAVPIDLDAYGGTVQMNMNRRFSFGEFGLLAPRFELRGTKIDLGQHPLFTGNQGLLNFRLTTTLLPESSGHFAVDEGLLQLSVDNGAYRGGLIRYGGFNCPIPETNEITLVLRATQRMDTIQIHTLELSSSLASATGYGRMQLRRNGTLEASSGELVVSLTKSGHEAVVACLTAAVGDQGMQGMPISQNLKWLIKLKTSGGKRPNLFDGSLKISPLGSSGSAAS